MTEFSSKLQSIRENKGWSKTKLAKEIGVSLSTYANWEYGIAEPDIETIKKICKALEVSSDVLLNLSSKNYSNISVDLNEMLNDARSFNGKEMTTHDRNIIKNLIKGYFSAK